tara:strand:- start:380 stop:580 length:201 start_codon:yes stop_codon:yes gene_type:complete
MFSPQTAGVQESITLMSLLEITNDRNLVFHIALASFALLSINVNEKLPLVISNSSSLTRLEAKDLA